jgi:hypothetical protein
MTSAAGTGGDGLGVVLGACADVRADVLVRPAVGPVPAGCRIVGTLTGPRRGRDTTLPVTARLQPTSGGSRAILTEPAYWTPDLPNLYRLEATVEGAAGPPVGVDRLVGLRRLGVRGRSLWLDGRRWVPRAVRASGLPGIDACKPATLAALVSEPDETLLEQANEIGVAVLAIVSSEAAVDPAAVADRIAGWAAHPSAIAAILPVGLSPEAVATIATTSRPRRDTLLLAASVAGADPPPESLPAGIDVLAVTVEPGRTPHGAWRAGAALPLLAWSHEPASPAAGRAPCDVLQATLAAWGTAGGRERLAWDWAGYVVG